VNTEDQWPRSFEIFNTEIQLNVCMYVCMYVCIYVSVVLVFLCIERDLASTNQPPDFYTKNKIK